MSSQPSKDGQELSVKNTMPIAMSMYIPCLAVQQHATAPRHMHIGATISDSVRDCAQIIKSNRQNLLSSMPTCFTKFCTSAHKSCRATKQPLQLPAEHCQMAITAVCRPQAWCLPRRKVDPVVVNNQYGAPSARDRSYLHAETLLNVCCMSLWS
jgi:hypothetical protein